jgi:hypothetical protein
MAMVVKAVSSSPAVALAVADFSALVVAVLQIARLQLVVLRFPTSPAASLAADLAAVVAPVSSRSLAGSGGGGGGYSGGNGGVNHPGAGFIGPGGGGGSFDAGTNQALVGDFWSGNGEVVINLVSPVFAGTPGKANCHGKSVSALAKQFGGLHNAAEELGYPSVDALQNAIMEFCGG